MTRADDTANERPPGRSDRPVEGDQADLAGAKDEADQPPRIGYIGKRLGRFHINAELGRGGMATVYRAHDPHVGRDVAVKVMHGFFAGRADIEARFRREANAVAAIRHPSILALYDFAPPVGEEPGYIVSELIEGPGLRVLAEERGGRLLPEVATSIATRVAEALGAAHAAGIVHRDVKPDNVLIDRGGGGSVRVVLTDFGVAHVGTMDTMTATGAVLGSPAFMSPEQARGDDVGPTSDVFSLGVLLYQLVTGHLPFSGKDPLALIAAILRGEYIRPGKLEARVGPTLEQVIVRCLQRDPAARFPDGRAVAAALRETLAASGFPDEEALLRRALPALDQFERETAPQIAERAAAAAEQARKARQIARALAEVGRALAYAPDQPAARALLERLGTQRRSPWVFAAVALAGVAAAAVIASGLWRRETSLPAQKAETSSPTAAGAVVPPPVAFPAPLPVEAPATPEAAPSALAVRPAAPNTAKPRSRIARAARPPISTASASVTTPNPAPSPPEPTPGAEAAPIAKATPDDPPPPVAAAPAPASSIILFASQGFCEPSLDEAPPSLLVRTYPNLAPGRHVIYCTLPQGDGTKVKVKVGAYDLWPGTHPSIIIRKGPDGRPMLGHPG